MTPTDPQAFESNILATHDGDESQRRQMQRLIEATERQADATEALVKAANEIATAIRIGSGQGMDVSEFQQSNIRETAPVADANRGS